MNCTVQKLIYHTGASGYVTKELVKQHVAPSSLGEKVKIFICGMCVFYYG